MTHHHQVLREVAERGLSLTVSGTELRLQGPRQRVDADLVGRIKAVKADLISHLSAQSRAAPNGYPLTALQRAYLIGRGESVEMGNIASHIYHEIDGCWDISRLESALRHVAARHGVLRARFLPEGRCVEEPEALISIGRLDLRGEPPAAQEERLAALRQERSHLVMPFDRAPMLAVDVTLLAPDRMRLHVNHDGLVMDGISMFLFFDEWWRCYSGDTAGLEGTGPEDAVSFGDYVAALDALRGKPAAQRSRAYWLGRVEDLPPRPGLPLRTSPASITHPRFRQHTIRLDPGHWAALKERAAAAKVTPTTMLLAAYAETLARWGAGTSFTLATTVANRPPIHPRIADAIGNFSETLLVEIAIDRQVTFADRARTLQARLRRDLDHRHFSGIEVLREIARRHPGADARMPVTFNSTIGYIRDDIDGSALELFGPEVYTSSQTPQVWLNGFAFEQHGAVVIQFDEVMGLFPDEMIAAMVQGYHGLLDSLLTPDAWSATTFDLLPADQRARRAAANDTAVPMPQTMLADRFMEQARRAPAAPAVLTLNGTVSYGDLCQRALRAATWLRARGTGRDELVGLIMHRGPEQIVGILAVVMAGGAYLPIDAALPAERVRYMLRDGRVRSVLTNAGWSDADEAIGALALDVSDPQGPAGEVPGEGGPERLPGAGPDDLAYVLYTSGTTGEPKGVMVSQRSVANVVADCEPRFGIGPADRFMGVSAFNFDLSVWDVFGALSAGAAIVLPDADRATDPEHWLDLCARFGVTVWNSVPAIVGLMREEAENDRGTRIGSLRLIMMSGDRIPPNLPEALWRLKPDLTLISLGGPTETTIWNISHPIERGDGGEVSIPYGRPNTNNRAYILDSDGLDTPDWVTGDICAAGTGLARGYWGDEARTAERFWHDERRGERLYRTGDLGRYLPDGDIDIAGRSDFQIKVNGYRIEAGEVESRLTAIGAVKQAVVVRQSAERGDRLVAHLVPAGDERPSQEQIRQSLREHLPDYMTPSAVIWHESLPLTRNGKVDRGKLTALTPSAGDATAGDGPRRAGGVVSDTERAVIELWASVLRVPAESIAPDSNFFDLGGDSLAAARIFTGVRKRFGVSITLGRLFEVQTVQSMAAAVQSGDQASRDQASRDQASRDQASTAGVPA